MKVYEIQLGNRYITNYVAANNFDEAVKKAKRLQVKYRKEDPSMVRSQWAINLVVEREDITRV